jgi:hypothetical protein
LYEAILVANVLNGKVTRNSSVVHGITCFKDVDGDHGVVVHNGRVVGLNETHATHICSKVEDPITAFHRLLAIRQVTEVQEFKFIAKFFGLEVLVFLPIHTDNIMAYKKRHKKKRDILM